MEGVRHAVGTRVRVNEIRDKNHGKEGVVESHMNAKAINTPYKTLVRFDEPYSSRWYADRNLEAVDGEEGE